MGSNPAPPILHMPGDGVIGSTRKNTVVAGSTKGFIMNSQIYLRSKLSEVFYASMLPYNSYYRKLLAPDHVDTPMCRLTNYCRIWNRHLSRKY